MDSTSIISDLRAIEDEVEQLAKKICKSSVVDRLGALLDAQEEERKDEASPKATTSQKRAYKNTIILTDCGECNFIIELDNKKDLEKALEFEQYARNGEDERARELDELTSIELIEMYLKDNKVDYSIKDADNFETWAY